MRSVCSVMAPAFAICYLITGDALASYLQSLPPVKHAVLGPFSPGEKVPLFVMEVLPAELHNNMPPSPSSTSLPPAK